MKISQRILILIILNIIALLGLTIVISHLSTTEQEYYIQSNNILDFRYTLSEKIDKEAMISQIELDPEEMERLRFDVNNKFENINKTLISSDTDLINQVEQLLKKEKRSLTR